MSIDVDIKKKIGDFDLDVQFSQDAKRIGILGASGCGKSMTLKTIAGIVGQDEGHVIVEGRTLFDKASGINLKPQQRNVGYMFQNYALFPTMTVAQNIAAGLPRDKSLRAKRVAEMLESFHLQGLEGRLPSELSGGQQQRVALARMMAYEPQVLLFDEPFSAMDAYLKEGLRLELLEVLKDYNRTAIFVTHDRDEAYQMCDYLILMDQGKILEAGPTKELFDRPGTKAAAKLTGCKNISLIEKIDEHTVRALDWGGLVLKVQAKVEDDIKAVGVRAHDFYEVEEQTADSTTNCFATGKCAISELPFEWYITLENGLWWKKSKDHALHDTNNIVSDFLAIRPESILLLKD